MNVYICVCARVHVCMCLRVCVQCACVNLCLRVRACVCAYVHACMCLRKTKALKSPRAFMCVCM